MRTAVGSGYRFGQFTLHIDQACVRASGSQLNLRPKSFDVLRYLVEHAGRLATKDEIITAVWPNVVVSDDSLAQCISDIRKALKDESERFIKTVPRRGYMFVAETQPLNRQETPSSEVDTAAHGSRRWRFAAPAAVVVAVVLAALAAWSSGLFTPQTTLQETRLTIAVLPFADVSERSDGNWLGDGIAEDIMTAVSRFRDIVVIARNSSFRYRDNADVRQIGHELNADFLLLGTVRRSSNQMRITAQLVESRSGASRWTERYDRPFADIFAIQDEIAGSVAALLVTHAREATLARIRTQPAESLETYELVLRARKAYHTFTGEAALEARALLERAIQVDPHYAVAWELLARLTLQFFVRPYDERQGDRALVREARAAAERAVMLDPNLSTAHATLGRTLFFLGEHDASLEALRTALSINPTDAESVRMYATTLGTAGFFRESLAAWDEGALLDPYFPPITYALRARNHVMLGEHDKALPLSRTCAERALELVPCFLFLAISANELGLVDEAGTAAQRVLELDPKFGIARHVQIIGYAKAEDAARFAEYMRRAGLPE
jgi:adenylate cyclase